MPAVFSDRFSPNGDYELTKVALARQDIPAEANAQAGSSPGEEVDLSCLLGHEYGLPLGQHDHLGHEF